MERKPKPKKPPIRQKTKSTAKAGGHAIILTPRERDCLQGLADGLSAKEIALGHGISPRTVEHHIARAQAKMQARTSAQAVARAVALNLILPAPI